MRVAQRGTMLLSLAVTVFLLCYTASGFSWKNGCSLFGWSFFAPVAVTLLALAWRYLDMQGVLTFLSAQIGQSQVGACAGRWPGQVGDGEGGRAATVPP